MLTKIEGFLAFGSLHLEVDEVQRINQMITNFIYTGLGVGVGVGVGEIGRAHV
jgi:hypothetical protein